MNKKTKLSILTACITLLAVSCEKEERFDFLDTSSQAECSVETEHVCYSIDKGPYCDLWCSLSQWDAFMLELLDLTRLGHSVSVYNPDTFLNLCVKETVVMKFPSSKDAVEWSKEMRDKGYRVDIFFDERDGVFVVTATR